MKYITYEEAVLQALLDRVPETEKDSAYQVLKLVSLERSKLVGEAQRRDHHPKKKNRLSLN